jgi:molybdenum cofactor synthesis domain-containing protein
VIVASTRAAAGSYPDRSGRIAVAELRRIGFEVGDPVVAADGAPVAAALREALADGVDLIVTSGGTGLSPTDRTPELTRELIDREVPGIAEALRAAGRAVTPQADLSRGLAGVSGATLIVNLPGSAGGVRDGMEVLAAIAGHAVDQIHGGDHPRPEGG